MSRKPYNGLKPSNIQMPFGGAIQSLARQPSKEEMQQMLSQQLQVLAREIYVRGASDVLGHPNATHEDYVRLATESQSAAKAYFEAMGVKFTEEPVEVPAPSADQAQSVE